jgi:hypothetical protein
MQDPGRDGAASLFADFNPDFDPHFLVVITMMVIDIDPLLDPDLEPGVIVVIPVIGDQAERRLLATECAACSLRACCLRDSSLRV